MTQQEQSRFTELLMKLGIPAESVKVFGGLRLNVHVVCRSRAAAGKWALALSTIEPGRDISCVRTKIERKKFKREASNQTHTSGWLVAL